MKQLNALPGLEIEFEWPGQNNFKGFFTKPTTLEQLCGVEFIRVGRFHFFQMFSDIWVDSFK